MLNRSSRSWFSVILMVLALQLAFAQKPPGSTRSGGMTGPPGAPVDTNSAPPRPLYISGSVILSGGTPLTEPVAIERVCNGVVQREGYTDFKGQFQIQLGSNTQFQDVTENPSNPNQSSMDQKLNRSNLNKYEGCELRALLAGFQSTSVLLHITDDFGEVKVGNIMLTRMGNVEGATISLTSMAAPNSARQAYEKGRKDEAEKKYAEAEKQLNKAVQIYPRYAAAWYLLGEIHRSQKQEDQAIAEYNQAVKSDPQYVSPYFGLTIIAVDHKRWDEVERLTSQLTHLNGMAYPMAYFYNGAANFNLGKLDAAQQSAVKFESLDTNHQVPDVHLLLAGIFEAKQDAAGALREFRAYLAQAPNSPRAAEIQKEADRLEAQGKSAQN